MGNKNDANHPDMQSSQILLNKFMKQCADRLQIEENIIEEIIRHQWKSTHEALLENKSVEITGLGKFHLRPKVIAKAIIRVEKAIEHFKEKLEEKPELKETDNRLTRTLAGYEADLIYLRTKQD